MADDVLIRLYNSQPISVDKLAATPEMSMLVSYYRVETGDYKITDGDLLKKLIALRKAHKLGTKRRRLKHVVVEEDYFKWPEAKDGNMAVEITIRFNRSLLVKLLSDNLPCSRSEAFDIIRKKLLDLDKLQPLPKYLIDTTTMDRVDQLFPELKGSSDSITVLKDSG